MLTKEKFEEIKYYVLNRLRTENPFEMDINEIYNNFHVQKPIYNTLIKMVEENEFPFYTSPVKAGYFDRADNEPCDLIRFSDKVL
jgi:peptide methionine sulfoxide reductase MsrB